jgi:hypothetical protein
MSVDLVPSSDTRSRRHVLVLLGTGGAAAIATLFGRSYDVSAHGNVHETANSPDFPAIHGENLSSGPGVLGTCASGPGVAAHSQTGNGVEGRSDGANGMSGFSQTRFGVTGHSESGDGVAGSSQTGDGVEGSSQSGAGGSFASQTGPGVVGGSQSGAGVTGHSGTGFGGSFSTAGGDFAVHVSGSAVHFALGVDNSLVGQGAGGLFAVSRGGKPAIEGDALPNQFSPGVGVQGVSGSHLTFGQGPGVGVQGISGTGVGVEAISTEGLALNVLGRVAFSTAGAGVIRRGMNADFIANPAVTTQSHISVALTDDPGQRQVRWIERMPGSGFTVHLSPPTGGGRPRTSLTYLIVESGA